MNKAILLCLKNCRHQCPALRHGSAALFIEPPLDQQYFYARKVIVSWTMRITTNSKAVMNSVASPRD
ncbi:MAG: hypothetical protein GXP18_05485 [Gammaproteobacteria bacterium]|nr:hypothetical protein [Gammaproteobacteria bacterium]